MLGILAHTMFTAARQDCTRLYPMPRNRRRWRAPLWWLDTPQCIDLDRL